MTNLIPRSALYVISATTLLLTEPILVGLRLYADDSTSINAAGVPSARPNDSGRKMPLVSFLAVRFIDGSASGMILERDIRKYVEDLVTTSRQMETAMASPRQKQEDSNQSGGASIFKEHCAICHGEDGKGISKAGTPDFTDPKVQDSLTDQQIVNTIKNGRKGTKMFAWADKLSAPEIDAVAKYVRSLGPKKSAMTQPIARCNESNAKNYKPEDDSLSLPKATKVLW